MTLLQKGNIKICLNKPIHYSTQYSFEEFKIFKLRQIHFTMLLKFMQENYFFFSIIYT